MALIHPNIKWLRSLAENGPTEIEIGSETFVVSVKRGSDES